ncbi:SNF2-related [Macleaya cordata]|uniref:SNF2-related n=1 Tax=Macleaya cordata TaxID=56857 RepID=A0A200QRU4_MACCD|nr:SNF2-related [Macleaya cordata]
MLKTDDNSDFWSCGDFSSYNDWDKFSIDLDSLYAILSEDSDPPTKHSQSSPEDLSCENSSQAESTAGEVNHERASQPQNGIQKCEEAHLVGPVLPESSLWYPPEYLEPSYSRSGMDSECFFGSPGNFGAMVFDQAKLEILSHIDSPVHSCSASLTDWLPNSHSEHDIWSGERIGGSMTAPFYSNTDSKRIPNCSTTFNFAPGDANQAPDCTDYVNLMHVKSEIEKDNEFQHLGGDLHLSCPSQFATMDKSAFSYGNHTTITGSSIEGLGSLETNPCTSPLEFPFMDARISLPNAPHAAIDESQVSGIKSEAGNNCSPASFCGLSSTGADNGPFAAPSSNGNGPSTEHASSQLLAGVRSLTSSKRETVCIEDEKEHKLVPPRSLISHSVKVAGEVVQSNTSLNKARIEDDADICILEDISDPRHPAPVVVHGKSFVTAQRSGYNDSLHPRLNTNDERLTFRVALQDLSQPKSEASPPDGVLSVPLLRHQRIALSWMVQKETVSLHCSGGILADDQGLGKTISTIALILKERSPSSKMSSMVVKEEESEALNLDDDDDGILDLDRMKQDGDSGHVMVNKSLRKCENAFVLAKGRPAAGTLVVCPTSVLRQWAEELHNKVRQEANLSVLVYHGSNRTRDPFELAKYDVVLTTYSIVSMEVPKQPLVDKDDEEKGKTEGRSPMELSSSRKRKYPPSSDKKNRKDKKGIDGALLEAVARPLARVGWFRVVLDEAQSIKNHRTQVARACWGLRAKRRWCLSGTPIQNAVDDLYSYFRFLRYDPYAVYKSFCSMIKVPINRNPTTGYKKLQAVLKTIMLRRTKATFIDGEPIITLPPKTIELKKVEFSEEERDFYSQLEADSRAQFKVYAAAGTVRQNYVNILLMLLRLRQACDHPLLVKGYDSNSVWKSSLEMAKKLSREKQMELLNCLEACLAICSICNDPPEDAVVTVCGHVFCNQCICEHLTGDDTLCPSAQCKVQLSVTSVFSRATLRSSLSDQSGHDYSVNRSGTQLIDTLEPCSEGPSESSKIRAALEVLQSLSKPGNHASKESSFESSDLVVSDSHCGESFEDITDKKLVDVEKGLDDSSTKVPEKAIVFSQWTRMLDLLEARLKTSSIQYRRLDGTMSVLARDKAVKDFNTIPEVSVMIMSLKAASLGLNMVAACHVLLLDLWWNPTTEDQAIDRAHRIGQTRPVSVLRLTVKDTVEDRILALQQKKREMVASAFGEDEVGGRQTRLTVDDLKYLFMV